MEVVSYFCDGNFKDKLTHSPSINEIKNLRLFVFDETGRFNMAFSPTWRTSDSGQYASLDVLEDGLCMTFNTMDASIIFRNDTVDPNFIKGQFGPDPLEFTPEFKREPVSWDIEAGYDRNSIKSYPLNSLKKGIESGFTVTVETLGEFGEIDTNCRKEPQNIKIALHHPVEVALKSNLISMPFNKSIQLIVKPKISRTDDSLLSYSPKV